MFKKKLVDKNTNKKTDKKINKLEYSFENLNLQTGDLVLFTSTKGIVSKVINLWTHSEYVHVGIIIKNVKLFLDYGKYNQKHSKYNNHNHNYHNHNYQIKDTEYGLLESGYEDVFDMAENNFKYGVQITPLKEKIDNYEGSVFIRKLKFKEELESNLQNLNFNLFNAYNQIKNKPYDLDLLDLLKLRNDFCSVDIEDYDNDKTSLIETKINQTAGLGAFKSWFKHDNQKMDKFVCSSLVAYIYTKLSFLPEDTLWTEWIPEYFSSKNKNLKLMGGVELMNEIKYKKN